MHTNSISSYSVNNFGKNIFGVLAKWRPKAPAVAAVSDAIRPGEACVMRKHGITVAYKATSTGEILKAVSYPEKVWPHTDLVFTDSMCQKVDKNLTGLRMTIPHSYIKKHPEVMTEEGATDFIKYMRELMASAQGYGEIPQNEAIIQLAKITGVNTPFAASINCLA
ncbi:MAG: hypothetical protein K6A44_05180 [bacterium]|nr:hypothetical protein [bacterium]